MKFLLLSLLLSVAASCNDKYPDLEDGLYAEIVTNKGTMLLTLHHDKTPVTVANFISLAEGSNTLVKDEYAGKKYYDSLTFHRVMKNFMIQGGDPLANGTGGPGYIFKDEFDPELKHDNIGILSMANPGPNSNGSQFFITLKETPWLDNKHSIFGKLVQGEEVLKSIGEVEVVPVNKPKEDIVILTINIIRKGKEAKKFDAPKVIEDELAAAEKAAKEKEEKLSKILSETKSNFNKMKENAETTATGLQYVFNTRSNGEKPKAGVRVKLDYAGYLSNGSLLDTSKEEIAVKFDKLAELKQMRRGQDLQPMTSPYSSEARFIAGFKEGMLLMSVGDKATFFIPSHLAWGERGAGSAIPPNEDVVFEIELLEIMK